MAHSYGPVILDLVNSQLSEEEYELLKHPCVGGVILFTRNFESVEQLTQLCKNIRVAANRALLICVDHEGGRVQRFREGFTAIPAMGKIGALYDRFPSHAMQLAEISGWLMATELLAKEIDLSFAPVLDLDKKVCPAIGDRAFHHHHAVVSDLAKAFIRGMHDAGMASTAKHFPGHGSVDVDSHGAMPIDERSFDEIAKEDLKPFIALIQSGIKAMMPAHILFPKVDHQPVGFSHYWLKTILRNQLNFSGMIFSDDLNMEGAKISGGYLERAEQALNAGCDMILICNNRKGAVEILDRLPHENYFVAHEKINSLRGNFSFARSHLHSPLKQDKQKIFLKLMQKIT